MNNLPTTPHDPKYTQPRIHSHTHTDTHRGASKCQPFFTQLQVYSYTYYDVTNSDTSLSSQSDQRDNQYQYFNTDKLILPTECLREIQSCHLKYPLIFDIANADARIQHTHQ